MMWEEKFLLEQNQKKINSSLSNKRIQDTFADYIKELNNMRNELKKITI